MADFRRNNLNITNAVGTRTSGNSGFMFNNVPYNVYGAPISNSKANLPYGYANPTGFTVNEVDICNLLGPKETGYSGSGTHTLTNGCSTYVNAGGGSGGAKGSSSWSSTPWGERRCECFKLQPYTFAVKFINKHRWFT